MRSQLPTPTCARIEVLATDHSRDYVRTMDKYKAVQFFTCMKISIMMTTIFAINYSFTRNVLEVII